MPRMQHLGGRKRLPGLVTILVCSLDSGRLATRWKTSNISLTSVKYFNWGKRHLGITQEYVSISLKRGNLFCFFYKWKSYRLTVKCAYCLKKKNAPETATDCSLGVYSSIFYKTYMSFLIKNKNLHRPYCSYSSAISYHILGTLPWRFIKTYHICRCHHTMDEPHSNETLPYVEIASSFTLQWTYFRTHLFLHFFF